MKKKCNAELGQLTSHGSSFVSSTNTATKLQQPLIKYWRVLQTTGLPKISLYFHRKEFNRISQLHPLLYFKLPKCFFFVTFIGLSSGDTIGLILHLVCD